MVKGRAITLVALLLSLLTLVGCAKAGTPIDATEDELRVIGQAGQTDISYDEFRFAVLQCRAQLVSEYGEEFLAREDAEELILRAVFDNITFNYAIIALCGEVGIHSERDGLAEAVQNEMVKTEKALGSRREYKKFLKENGLTDRLLRFNTLVDKMQNELYYVYTDDLGIIKTSEEDVYGEIQRDFVRTKHIFI